MNASLASRIRAVTLGCGAALIATLSAWQLTPAPSAKGALHALLLSIPALAPLPGLWRGSRYTYRWATLCVMPYVVVGITEVIANPNARAWSAALLFWSLAWFVSLVAYLRATRH